MGLPEYVNDKIKSPYARVIINGVTYRDIISIELSDQYENGIASATITFANHYKFDPESKVVVIQGYNGKGVITFTGYLDTVTREEKGLFTIECRDVLKKALDTFLVQEVKFGVDINLGKYYYSTYTNFDGGTFHVHEYDNLGSLQSNHPETVGNFSTEGVKCEAVVQWMLVMCGFAEGKEIQVEDTDFWVGDITPVTFHLTSVYDGLQQLANLIGWRVYADKSGVVRFGKYKSRPSLNSSWVYDTNSNVYTLSKSTDNLDLRNYVEVRGYSGIKVVKRGNSAYIGNMPYRGVLVSDEMIDTPGIAEYFANRMYRDLNRLKTRVSLAVDGNPYLKVGETVSINAKVGSGKFLVESINTSMSASDGYKMSFDAAQFPTDDTPFDDGLGEPSIKASFVCVSATVIGDPVINMELDASASYSKYGPIISYEWKWPDNSTETHTIPQAFLAIDSVELEAGVSVTLTVRDGFGHSASVTSGLSPEWVTTFVSMKYRHLYAALTQYAAGSTDSGDTWNMLPIPAISVAASNYDGNTAYVPNGYALFGGSNGTVYRTSNNCISYIPITVTNHPITSISISEFDSQFALFGTSNGEVWKSTNSGATWLKIFTIPESGELRDTRYGYQNTNYILAVSTNAVYESYDGGITWAKLPYSVSVTKESSGATTNYYAHTSGIIANNGGVVTSVPFKDNAIPNIVALTIAVDNNEGIMAVDNTGQHWVYSGQQMIKTQHNPTNKAVHMVRDGVMQNLVYYATASGVGKSLDNNINMSHLLVMSDYTPVPQNGWGRQVAYGPFSDSYIPGRILLQGRLDGSEVRNLYEIATISGQTVEHIVQPDVPNNFQYYPNGTSMFGAELKGPNNFAYNDNPLTVYRVDTTTKPYVTASGIFDITPDSTYHLGAVDVGLAVLLTQPSRKKIDSVRTVLSYNLGGSQRAAPIFGEIIPSGNTWVYNMVHTDPELNTQDDGLYGGIVCTRLASDDGVSFGSFIIGDGGSWARGSYSYMTNTSNYYMSSNKYWITDQSGFNARMFHHSPAIGVNRTSNESVYPHLGFISVRMVYDPQQNGYKWDPSYVAHRQLYPDQALSGVVTGVQDVYPVTDSIYQLRTNWDNFDIPVLNYAMENSYVYPERVYYIDYQRKNLYACTAFMHDEEVLYTATSGYTLAAFGVFPASGNVFETITVAEMNNVDRGYSVLSKRHDSTTWTLVAGGVAWFIDKVWVVPEVQQTVNPLK